MKTKLKSITKSFLAPIFIALSVFTSSIIATSFEWDPVNDNRVEKYMFFWGQESGVYNNSVDILVPKTSYLISLTEPGTYYVAVKACTADELICSDFSEELEVPVFSAPLNLRIVKTDEGTTITVE